MNIEQWLERPALRLANIWANHRVGILLTLAVNLLALVILLSVYVQGQARFIESEVLFAIEEPEVEQPQEKPVEEITRHTAWERETQPQEVRNIAVNQEADKELNAGLGDEKAIDAEELYKEAARVRAEMEANRERYMQKDELSQVSVPNTTKKTVAPPGKSYQGPSVVSYSLKGRNAYELPVPAYRCKGGGIVVVDITVNREGRVVAASIDAPNSEQDPCLHSEAQRAARRSFFNPEPHGPATQQGSITYMFVAQ